MNNVADKQVSSIREVELKELRWPMVAVYEHPEDFPEQCVGRLFDIDKPTNIVIVAETKEDIMRDIRANTSLVCMHRSDMDVPCLIAVWM